MPTWAEWAIIAWAFFAEDYDSQIAACGKTDRAVWAAAEIAYWRIFDELPPWACVLESIEFFEDGTLFVHRDPDEYVH